MKTRPVLTLEDCVKISAAAEAEARRSSDVWEEIVKGGRTTKLKMHGILPVQGGMPTVADGTCIGAVGGIGRPIPSGRADRPGGINALLKG